jgi:hypothetical protein
MQVKRIDIPLTIDLPGNVKFRVKPGYQDKCFQLIFDEGYSRIIGFSFDRSLFDSLNKFIKSQDGFFEVVFSSGFCWKIYLTDVKSFHSRVTLQDKIISEFNDSETWKKILAAISQLK